MLSCSRCRCSPIAPCSLSPYTSSRVRCAHHAGVANQPPTFFATPPPALAPTRRDARSILHDTRSPPWPHVLPALAIRRGRPQGQLLPREPYRRAPPGTRPSIAHQGHANNASFPPIDVVRRVRRGPRPDGGHNVPPWTAAHALPRPVPAGLARVGREASWSVGAREV